MYKITVRYKDGSTATLNVAGHTTLKQLVEDVERAGSVAGLTWERI